MSTKHTKNTKNARAERKHVLPWSIYVCMFSSSSMQFGFKPKHSTTQCTFVLNEIVEFYNNNDSPVFLVALDASKAFDRVEYCKLFNLLIDRNICPLYARLLIYMYTHQCLRVRWNNMFSEFFSVTNLVFCIYVYFR